MVIQSASYESHALADRTASACPWCGRSVADRRAGCARPLLAHHVPTSAAVDRQQPKYNDRAGSAHSHRLFGLLCHRAADLRAHVRPFRAASHLAVGSRDFRGWAHALWRIATAKVSGVEDLAETSVELSFR